MIRNKKVFSLCALFLAALFVLLSCGNAGKRVLESSDTDKIVVMTVDGFDVPLELYRYLALNYKADAERGRGSGIWTGDAGSALLAELNENVNHSLMRLYAVLSVCRDYGIGADDPYILDAVNLKMNDVYEEAGNDYEAFADYLKTANMTDGVYRFIVRNDILAEELMAKMSERGELPVSEAELEDIVAGPEFVRVKQILVPADNGKSEAENEARAKELLDLAQSGLNFDDLVQKYGGDVFSFNNPDGYYVTRGIYHQAFEDAAFSLSDGEISGIVRTDAGWSILRRYEKEAAYLADHFDELVKDYRNGQFNRKVEEAAAGLTVTPTERLADYTIFNLDSTY
ncbi:MAG: peptidylprolyl isomerase [Clostridia bacterium]|nr:peptidylprolyl isomerase [Clostridia bacterium]